MEHHMTFKNYDASFSEAARALFDTLSPEQQERARRMGGMQAAYIGTKRDLELDREFDRVTENAAAALFGKSGKARALFVLGESGSGKTTSVEKHIAKRRQFLPRTTADGVSVRPLVPMLAPKPLTLKGLALAGLGALNYEVHNTRISGFDLFKEWKNQLREQQALFLAIDELQHVLRGDTVKELQTVADVLKDLLQIPGWPLHMFLSGVPALAGFLHQDGESERQLKERSHIIEFRRMSFPEDIPVTTKIVEKIIRVEACLEPRDVLHEEFVHRILHSSHFAFGSSIELTRIACDNAMRLEQDYVGPANFIAAYALKSGCRPSQNIFAVKEGWLDILPINSLQELLDSVRRPARSTKGR
ncbi:AAA family ATPase [Rhizobium leguminosarum]|nr:MULTISPECIES: AAA family ATPase [Rhizobium]MDI5929085.1 AAA family ATPase [Rhizobium leguminosarum]